MLDRLVSKVCRLISDRLPYRVIERPDGGPYLVRYYLLGGPRDKNSEDGQRGLNVYLHLFLSGDEEQELHSHPWGKSVSLILSGGYREERRVGNQVVTRTVRPGTLNFIAADDFHRVDLLKDHAWTLFFAGRVVQTWGFWNRTSGEFIPWREQVFIRRPRPQRVEA